MDSEIIGKSVIFGVLSAIFGGIYLAVVLTNDYLSQTSAALYGSLIIISVFVVFVVFVYLTENGGYSGCLARTVVFTLAIGAGICLVYSAVQILMIANDSFYNDEVTYEVIENIPNAWVLAMLFAPIIGGLFLFMGVPMAAREDDEVPVFWSFICYPGSYILCAIISLIFSTNLTIILTMGVGGILVVIDAIMIFRWAAQFVFGI